MGERSASDSLSPAFQRRRLESALALNDYTLALSSLHAYFDLAYGTSLGGGSALTGSTTAQSLLSPSLLADTALFAGPLARARELLLAASTGPPVGGTPLGRPLAHYPLLHLAALELWFGRAAAAVETLKECARVAAANGDAACGSYCVELLMDAEVEAAVKARLVARPAAAPPVAESLPPPVDAAAVIDVLLRLRSRAGEMGLWRQQASVALRLAELRYGAGTPERREPSAWLRGFSEMSRAARQGTSPSMRLSTAASLCDWLSLDPCISFRLGGHSVGLAGVCPPSHMGPLSITPSPGHAAVATAAAAALTAVREGTRTTALASPLQVLHLAHARRVRAVTDSGGGSNANRPGAVPPVPHTPATLQTAVAALPAPQSAAYWAPPASLSFPEVAALYAASHASCARMWGVAHIRGRGEAGSAFPSLHALRHAAEVCAGTALAAASWQVPAWDTRSQCLPELPVLPAVPDFEAVLDSLCGSGGPATDDATARGIIIPACPLRRLPRAPGDVAVAAMRVATDCACADPAFAAALPSDWPTSAGQTFGPLFALLGNPVTVATGLAYLADSTEVEKTRKGPPGLARTRLAALLQCLQLGTTQPVSVVEAFHNDWEAIFAQSLCEFCECLGADAAVVAAAIILIARALAGTGRRSLAESLLHSVEQRVPTLPVGGVSTDVRPVFIALLPQRLMASSEAHHNGNAVNARQRSSCWRGADYFPDALALFAQCSGDGSDVFGQQRCSAFTTLVMESKMARAGALAIPGSGARPGDAEVLLRAEVVPLISLACSSAADASASVGSLATALELQARAALALNALRFTLK